MITYFFLECERSDFWLRLLFAEVFDFLEESIYVRLIVFCLLFDLYLFNLDALLF